MVIEKFVLVLVKTKCKVNIKLIDFELSNKITPCTHSRITLPNIAKSSGELGLHDTGKK